MGRDLAEGGGEGLIELTGGNDRHSEHNTYRWNTLLSLHGMIE